MPAPPGPSLRAHDGVISKRPNDRLQPHFNFGVSLSMSLQPNTSTTSRRDDDEYEFPDELEGIDWSVVGPIEGDEPEPETTAVEQTQTSAPVVPPTDLPPRPGSSSSSYGFADIETLDADDLAELDETERLYGLVTGKWKQLTPPLCTHYDR